MKSKQPLLALLGLSSLAMVSLADVDNVDNPCPDETTGEEAESDCENDGATPD